MDAEPVVYLRVPVTFKEDFEKLSAEAVKLIMTDAMELISAAPPLAAVADHGHFLGPWCKHQLLDTSWRATNSGAACVGAHRGGGHRGRLTMQPQSRTL